MKALEEKILKEGTVLPGNVLKVGSFLNQQMDSDFIMEIGNEIARLYAGEDITRGLTVESSGIALAVAAGKQLTCPVCGKKFFAPSAEELAFNSQGACPACGGTGIVRAVDRSTLVPDENLTIEGGAVAPWNALMWSLMVDVCRAMGVRTDVPFRELTQKEKEIVFDGPP